jgi:type VI secretion system secreted protein VgrG
MGRSAIIVDPDTIIIKGDAIRFEGLNEVDIKAGSGRVTVKRDGTVAIKAKSFDVDASGNVTVKASGDLRLKGSKILQN